MQPSDNALQCSEMLTYTKAAVTRNQSEKKINSLLDHVSQSSDMKLLQDFYSITLSSLAEANNERLWFKTQLKLCGLWFKLKEFSRMHKILKELHRSAYFQSYRSRPSMQYSVTSCLVSLS